MLRSSRARRAALSGVVLLAALAAPPGAPAERAAANRFLNPGFELSLPDHPWMPAAWDTSVSGLLSVFFGRDTFVVHGGQYAVSVANLSTLVPMAHNWSQSFIVDRAWWGKDVVYSIWTRSNGLQGRAFIRASIYRDSLSKMARLWGVSRDHAGNALGLKPIDDPQLELGWKSLYFLDPETDWVRREVRLHIPASTNWLRLSFGISAPRSRSCRTSAFTVASCVVCARSAA